MAGQTEFYSAGPLKAHHPARESRERLSTKGIGGLDMSEDESKGESTYDNSQIDESPDSKPVRPSKIATLSENEDKDNIDDIEELEKRVEDMEKRIMKERRPARRQN